MNAAEQRGRQWAIDALRDHKRWAKWCAEAMVAAGAAYIDIRQPDHPADYLEALATQPTDNTEESTDVRPT